MSLLHSIFFCHLIALVPYNRIIVCNLNHKKKLIKILKTNYPHPKGWRYLFRIYFLNLRNNKVPMTTIATIIIPPTNGLTLLFCFIVRLPNSLVSGFLFTVNLIISSSRYTSLSSMLLISKSIKYGLAVAS